MGHASSPFLTHLPANTPVQLPKIQPKSFIKRILPVTYTGPIICTQNDAISMKTRIFVGWGEGVSYLYYYVNAV